MRVHVSRISTSNYLSVHHKRSNESRLPAAVLEAGRRGRGTTRPPRGLCVCTFMHLFILVVDTVSRLHKDCFRGEGKQEEEKPLSDINR